jgi:hypothetical protein
MMNANLKRLRITAVAVAVGGLAVAGGTYALSANAGPARLDAASGLASTPTPSPTMTTGNGRGYRFQTLDNANDVTFNQLLGINNEGAIAGYFGSGAQDHPNKGYLLLPPYSQGSYQNENFPGSVQTQVTGLNDLGVTVGFWSSMNNASQVNDNFAFYRLRNGTFGNANFPTGDAASPPVDQLLGVNDSDVAVGFWTDGQGNNHGYTYNIRSHRFTVVSDPNAPSAGLTAAAINNFGQIAGFYANPATGNTDGFLQAGGRFIDLAVPGAASTMALGVNDLDEVVGVYTVGSGSNSAMHGFTWTPRGGFTSIDDPHGMGTTTINGVNDRGDLVGFYVDSVGNTDGFLVAPQH